MFRDEIHFWTNASQAQLAALSRTVVWTTATDDLDRDEDTGKDPEDAPPATDTAKVPAPGEAPEDDANLAGDPPSDAVTEG